MFRSGFVFAVLAHFAWVSTAENLFLQSQGFLKSANSSVYTSIEASSFLDVSVDLSASTNPPHIRIEYASQDAHSESHVECVKRCVCDHQRLKITEDKLVLDDVYAHEFGVTPPAINKQACILRIVTMRPAANVTILRINAVGASPL